MNDTTNVTKRRFTVGTPEVFLRFDYTGPGRFGSTYIPWLDTLNAIEILDLACVEHHKVRGEWDDESDEPKYDGFIFTDAQGTVYHNQYPRAAYGQLDDSQDRMVSQAEFCEETFDHFYELARYRLECLYDTANRKKSELTPEQADALQSLFNQIVEKIEALGYTVTLEPHYWRFTDGRPPELSGRMKVRIEKETHEHNQQ